MYDISSMHVCAPGRCLLGVPGTWVTDGYNHRMGAGKQTQSSARAASALKDRVMSADPERHFDSS